MATTKQRTPLVEEVRPYVEGVAKNLVDKLYGPDGPPWGTHLSSIEHLLLELRGVLTEKFLAEALARQAATHPQRPPAWQEPQAYCRNCRQAFFPSVGQSGA